MEQRRTKSLDFWVTPDELECLRAGARAASSSLSAFVRDAALRAAEQVRGIVKVELGRDEAEAVLKGLSTERR
ncbi:MAG TPA: hypothetical protein VKQ05_12865 [Gemmatimonadales bacterium]|nr:hypothetical protein [Gemmatimonadales bacterium]